MARTAAATNLIPLPNAAPSQMMADLAWWSDTLRAKNRSGATIESYRLTLATLDRFLSHAIVRAPAGRSCDGTARGRRTAQPEAP